MTSSTDERYAPPVSMVADVASNPQNLVLASRWRRLAGAFLDGLLVGVPAMLLSRMGHLNLYDPLSLQSLRGRAVQVIVFSLIFAALNGYLLVTQGQTIAKAALGMRIVRPDGSRAAAFKLLVLRYGLGYLANLVVFIGVPYQLIDNLLIFRASRRCLHDEIAGTIVILD